MRMMYYIYYFVNITTLFYGLFYINSYAQLYIGEKSKGRTDDVSENAWKLWASIHLGKVKFSRGTGGKSQPINPSFLYGMRIFFFILVR